MKTLEELDAEMCTAINTHNAWNDAAAALDQLTDPAGCKVRSFLDRKARATAKAMISAQLEYVSTLRKAKF